MTSLGIIGGADGATAIFVTGPDPKFWVMLEIGRASCRERVCLYV